MNQKNDNFIDKTFTVLADVLIKVLPATKDEKKAFSYYRYGMSAQSNGDYAEALENYYEALKLEEDPYDRSYILYNIGLIYGNNGDYSKALEYYHQALDLNSRLPQALNNIAVIYHYQGEQALKQERFEASELMFEKLLTFGKRRFVLLLRIILKRRIGLKLLVAWLLKAYIKCSCLFK